MSERSFELARGVLIKKDPDDMTKAEAVDAIYDLAAFASQKLYESITLRRIIENISK